MDNTDRVIASLKRNVDYPLTAREIADEAGIKPATASAILRRLAEGGRARQLGVASSGGRTWTLTDNG